MVLNITRPKNTFLSACTTWHTTTTNYYPDLPNGAWLVQEKRFSFLYCPHNVHFQDTLPAKVVISWAKIWQRKKRWIFNNFQNINLCIKIKQIVYLHLPWSSSAFYVRFGVNPKQRTKRCAIALIIFFYQSCCVYLFSSNKLYIITYKTLFIMVNPLIISKLLWQLKKMLPGTTLELKCSTLFSLSLTIMWKGIFLLSLVLSGAPELGAGSSVIFKASFQNRVDCI